MQHASRERICQDLCQVAKYAPWGRIFAKLPYFAKSFAKLLEGCFKDCCQKSRMPTPFAKLLEMLVQLICKIVLITASSLSLTLDRVCAVVPTTDIFCQVHLNWASVLCFLPECLDSCFLSPLHLSIINNSIATMQKPVLHRCHSWNKLIFISFGLTQARNCVCMKIVKCMSILKGLHMLSMP